MRRLRETLFYLLAAGAFGQTAAATDLLAVEVDPTDRSDVVRQFHEAYLSSENFADHHGWNGNVASHNAGSLSARIHDDTIRRVNYFRSLAGLPAEITLSEDLNAKCQQAALMMAYNNDLNHNPPSSWQCYSADGASAAANSNLSWGFNTDHYGPAAVDGQMQDDGAGNAAVGHRRWLLHTKAPDQMGHGSIPSSPIVGDTSNDNSTMAIWITGPSTSELADDFEFVAWPPSGHVPYQLAFARWSFALPVGSGFSPDFTSANVTMTHDGANVPLTVIHRSAGPGVGDPTLVWEPNGFPLSSAPGSDQTYTVNISGITRAPQSSYSYEVTVIDPHTLSPIALSGRSTPFVGHPNSYQFDGFSVAQGYQLRAASIGNGDWIEGAESSPTPEVIDRSDSSHPLTVTALQQSGSRAFHLVEAGDSFEIDRSILPGASSQLKFHHRFRWVGNGTSLVAEVQSNGGSWIEEWRRTGTLRGSASTANWDSAWAQASINLAAYSGTTIRIRFRYEFDNGFLWFPNPGETATNFGAFIDSIQVSNSGELSGETMIDVPAGSANVEFNPTAAGQYQLQLRAQVADTWFGYGPATAVTAVIGTPPTIAMTGTGLDASGDLFIKVEASGYSTLQIEASTDGGQTWSTDDSFVATSPVAGQFTFSAPVEGSGPRIFRVRASE